MDGLVDGAVRALDGARRARTRSSACPAPSSSRRRQGRGRRTGFDAVVALGVVIRGGTPHFEYVCQAATDGLPGSRSTPACPSASACSPATTRSRRSPAPASRLGRGQGARGGRGRRSATVVTLRGLVAEGFRRLRLVKTFEELHAELVTKWAEKDRDVRHRHAAARGRRPRHRQEGRRGGRRGLDGRRVRGQGARRRGDLAADLLHPGAHARRRRHRSRTSTGICEGAPTDPVDPLRRHPCCASPCPTRVSSPNPPARCCARPATRPPTRARELVVQDPDNDVEFFFLRPRDIAIYVASGQLDVGITGLDLLLDSGVEADVLLELGFAPSTFRFAAPKADGGRRRRRSRASASRRPTPASCARHLAELGIEATVVKLDGAVENAVRARRRRRRRRRRRDRHHAASRPASSSSASRSWSTRRVLVSAPGARTTPRSTPSSAGCRASSSPAPTCSSTTTSAPSSSRRPARSPRASSRRRCRRCTTRAGSRCARWCPSARSTGSWTSSTTSAPAASSSPTSTPAGSSAATPRTTTASYGGCLASGRTA